MVTIAHEEVKKMEIEIGGALKELREAAIDLQKTVKHRIRLRRHILLKFEAGGRRMVMGWPYPGTTFWDTVFVCPEEEMDDFLRDPRRFRIPPTVNLENVDDLDEFFFLGMPGLLGLWLPHLSYKLVEVSEFSPKRVALLCWKIQRAALYCRRLLEDYQSRRNLRKMIREMNP